MNLNQSDRHPRLKRAFARFGQFPMLASIVITVAVLLGLSGHVKAIGSFFGACFSAASPILIGVAVAYVVNVPLRPLEKLWDKLASKRNRTPHPKFRRVVCMILCFLAILGLVAAVVLMILPGLRSSFASLSDEIPHFAEEIRAWISKLTDKLEGLNFSFELPEINLDKLSELLRSFSSDSSADPMGRLFSTVVSLLGGLLRVGVVLFVAIYLLYRKESAGKKAKKLVSVIFSEKTASRIFRLASLLDESFTNFITGQFLEAIIIGVLCFIGTLILRMPYAGVVSTLVGFTALIPIFGALFGTAVGAFLILLVNPLKAVWFVLFILVLQQLEDNLIYPKVVGTSVGLPGFWTLFALTVGGKTFGLLGMLIGVPLFAVFYELFGSYIYNRLKKRGFAPAEIK